MPEYIYQNTSQKYDPMTNSRPVGQQVRGPVYLEDNRESTKQLQALQRLMNPVQKQENKTGLPDSLKSSMEIQSTPIQREYISPVDGKNREIEAPWQAIESWLNAGDAGADAFAVGGRRAAGGANQNITIKWVNAIQYGGQNYTVRANIHFGPGFVGGFTLGSIWLQGMANSDINLNNTTARVAVITSIARDCRPES